MLRKFITNTSKKSSIKNQNGNILIVAIIIITVLSFSVSTIAGMSVNLASSTTNQMNIVTEESEAKANIKKAINFFEDWVKTEATLGVINFNDFDVLYANNPSNIYGVTVYDDSSSFPDLAEGNFAVAKAYKFSVTLSNNVTIYMHDFVSDVGVQTQTFEPFSYSLGTSGDLVINSGFFGGDNYGTPEPIKLFGTNIYVGRRAPFTINGTNNQTITSNTISRDPVFTDYSLNPDLAAEIHYNNDLKYCGDGSCYVTNNSGNPIEFVRSSFNDFTSTVPADQGTIGSVIITDFFGEFSYIDYIMNFVRKEAPDGSAPNSGNDIEADWNNLAYDISDESSPISVTEQGPWWNRKIKISWPNAEFADITDYADQLNFSQIPNDAALVYFGDDTTNYYPYNHSYFNSVNTNPLVLDDDVVIGIEGSLVVFGDLYINGNWGTQDILGEIIVTGDLYITGNDKNYEGSLMVFGETFVNLNDDRQFRTYGQNSGITFMCKDNIHFISHDENHYNSSQSDIFYMFIYTEESIYIDAVNSRYNFSGVMFSRALGNSKRTDFNDYMMIDSVTNEPIRGIVINSFFGYYDNSGIAHDGNDSVDSFRFNLDIMSSSSYASKFENLPEFPSETIVSTGDLNFYASEFKTE